MRAGNSAERLADNPQGRRQGDAVQVPQDRQDRGRRLGQRLVVGHRGDPRAAVEHRHEGPEVVRRGLHDDDAPQQRGRGMRNFVFICIENQRNFLI